MQFRRSAAAAVAALALSGVACTPARQHQKAAATTTETVTHTVSPRATITSGTSPVAPARSTGPLPQPHEVVTRHGACPYIDTVTAQNLNGSRINPRKNQITTTSPVGCRFFALNAAGYGQHAPAGRPEVDISTARYRTPSDAQQGMVRTALKGSDINPVKVSGHEGAQFRTRFNPSDGDQDWACAFATGTLVVTVKTDRTDLAFNAVRIAAAIAPKFD